MALTFKGYDINALVLNLDVAKVSQDYSIRYETGIDDYNYSWDLYYESEATTAQGYQYYVRYTSTTEDDSLNYTIRYTSNEEQTDRFETYSIKYDSEGLDTETLRYGINYTSEGLETMSFKTIYRIAFESEGSKTHSLNYKIRSQTEQVEVIFKDYYISYDSVQSTSIQTSFSTLKTATGESYALVGIHKKTINTPNPGYLVFTNTNRYVWYEVEADSIIEEVDINSVPSYILDSFRIKYPSYITTKFYLVPDVDPSSSYSLDCYEDKLHGKLLNDEESIFISEPYQGIGLTLNGIEFTGFSSTSPFREEYLNFVSEKISVTVVRQDSNCCFRKEIKTTNNSSCTP